MSSWTDTHNSILQALANTNEANPMSLKDIAEATGLSKRTVRDNVSGEYPSRRVGRTVFYWMPIDSHPRKGVTFGEYALNVKRTLFGLGFDVTKGDNRVQETFNQFVFEGYVRLDTDNPLNQTPKHPSQTALELKRHLDAVLNEDDRAAMASKGLQQA